MTGTKLARDAYGAAQRTDGPTDEDVLALGRLHFLAAFCPLHARMPVQVLNRMFIPALNHQTVKFFENKDGRVAAALVWARLNDDVCERMIYDRIPPRPEEWASGSNLFFVDLLAPFGQGIQIARHLARNPPSEAFYFARVDATGKVKRVIEANATQPPGKRLRAFLM